MRKFISELRRRLVFRSMATYLLMAWLVVQVLDVVGPSLGLPERAMTYAVISLAVGFPVVAIVSWFFELTTHGLIRESTDADAPQPPASNAINYVIIYSGSERDRTDSSSSKAHWQPARRPSPTGAARAALNPLSQRRNQPGLILMPATKASGTASLELKHHLGTFSRQYGQKVSVGSPVDSRALTRFDLGCFISADFDCSSGARNTSDRAFMLLIRLTQGKSRRVYTRLVHQAVQSGAAATRILIQIYQRHPVLRSAKSKGRMGARRGHPPLSHSVNQTSRIMNKPGSGRGQTVLCH